MNFRQDYWLCELCLFAHWECLGHLEHGSDQLIWYSYSYTRGRHRTTVADDIEQLTLCLQSLLVELIE